MSTKFFIGFLAPGVILDTALDTGYHLMKLLRERWIEKRNATYYYNKNNKIPNNEEEEIRQHYLGFFKGLKQIIPTL